jgi:hypothetical protein
MTDRELFYLQNIITIATKFGNIGSEGLSAMHEVDQSIGGQARKSAAFFERINPVTGAVATRASAATPA